MSISIYEKKDMVDSRIRTRHLWLHNCDDTPHICNMQDNSSADDSARRRQNQKKNSDYWNEYFLFDIFFL